MVSWVYVNVYAYCTVTFLTTKANFLVDFMHTIIMKMKLKKCLLVLMKMSASKNLTCDFCKPLRSLRSFENIGCRGG